jgi:hypothetical protein
MAKPKTKCFYCGEEVEDDDKVIENVTEKSRRGFHKSKNCFQEYLNNDKKTKSMLQKEAEEESKAENKAEWAEWDTVYQYVKKEVLGYTEGMILSPYQRRRLQSLRNGTFIARGSTMQNMGYSYKIILDTFKICKQQIINAT